MRAARWVMVGFLGFACSGERADFESHGDEPAEKDAGAKSNSDEDMDDRDGGPSSNDDVDAPDDQADDSADDQSDDQADDEHGTDSGSSSDDGADDGSDDAPDDAISSDDDGPVAEPGERGSDCDSDAQCVDGHCTDGVCCNETCDDACAACNSPGAVGTCSALGSDDMCPALSCPADSECRSYGGDNPPDNCFERGQCATVPVCAISDAPADTPCANGTGGCDGNGECVVANKNGLGESCGSDDECASAHCAPGVDGETVCCDSACDETCTACGSSGHCDATPSDDSACSVDCPDSEACVSYPEAPTDNRCVAFGQCVTQEAYCQATYADSNESCGSGMACDGAGTCESLCSDALVWCDEQCVDPAFDADHCGASSDCSGANAGDVCEPYQCVLADCKSWGAPKRIAEAATSGGGRPALSSDSDGNVFFAYSGSDSQSLWLKRWSAADGTWETEVPLDEAASDTYYVSPAIAVDADGNALAAWWSSSGVGWARYQKSNGEWIVGAPFDDQVVHATRLVFTSDGNAILGWDDSIDAAATGVWARRWNASTKSWSAIDPIGNPDAPNLGMCDIVPVESGNALFIYSEDSVAYSRRWNAVQAQWETRQPIGNGYCEVAARDAEGNVAIALRTGGGEAKLGYKPSQGSWSYEDVGVTGSLSNASSAFDENGNVLVVLRQTDGTSSVVANRYVPANDSWGGAQKIMDGGNGVEFSQPSLACDGHGNCLVVAAGSDDQVYVRWWRSQANDWDDGPTPIRTLPDGQGIGGFGPKLTLDPLGNATVVWPEVYDSTSSAGHWAIRYQ